MGAMTAPASSSGDRFRTRMMALASTLSKTDRILTGDRGVGVTISNSETTKVNAPAFSDGQRITINSDKFRDIHKQSTMIALLGGNYHELSHILFTPRHNTPLVRSIRNLGLGMAFNALEDQRIETLFTAIYEPARKFFTSMVVRFFVEDQKTWPLAFMLTHGRRYLPKDIRDEFEKRFAAPKYIDQAKAIIDEYRLLSLSGGVSNSKRVEYLVREWQRIYTLAANNAQTSLNQHDCTADQENGSVRKNMSDNAAKSAEKKTKEADEKEEDGDDASGFWDEIGDDEGDETDSTDGDTTEDEENDDDSTDDAAGDADDGGEERATEGDASEDDGEADEADEGSDGGEDADEGDEGEDEDGGDAGGQAGEGDADDADDADEDDVRGSARGGAGGKDSDANDTDSDSDAEVEDSHSTAHGGGGMTASDLASALEDILNAIEDSETVKNEVRQIRDAMNDPNNFDINANKASFREVDAPPQVMQTMKRVSSEFRRLWAELEPGWRYGSDQGRLNVTRVLTSDDPDEWFDEWDSGKEADSGLEVVIALDLSSSMMGKKIADAQSAMWVIKRACDELDATVSVIGFHWYTLGIYSREDKASRSSIPVFDNLGGNTAPAHSFKVARRILGASSMPHKLFFVITDGGWANYTMEDEFGAAKGTGGVTSGVYEDLDALIQLIPGTKVFVGIEMGKNGYEHNFDLVRNISNGEELVGLMKNTMEQLIRSSRR